MQFRHYYINYYCVQAVFLVLIILHEVFFAIIESSVRSNMGCQSGTPGLVWQKIQEPLTQNAIFSQC